MLLLALLRRAASSRRSRPGCSDGDQAVVADPRRRLGRDARPRRSCSRCGSSTTRPFGSATGYSGRTRSPRSWCSSSPWSGCSRRGRRPATSTPNSPPVTPPRGCPTVRCAACPCSSRRCCSRCSPATPRSVGSRSRAPPIATVFLVGHRRNSSVARGVLEVRHHRIGRHRARVPRHGRPRLRAARRGRHRAPTRSNWDTLTADRRTSRPATARLAGGLLLLGYGTKVGLAPMHTWLPDAHSQAPAPVSALMSGVLLAVAFSVFLRFKVVIDAAAGPSYLRGLLIADGAALARRCRRRS